LPPPTFPPSWSRWPRAAAMISVARMSLISVAENPFGFERFEMPKPAAAAEIIPMVLGAANVGVDVFADAVGAFGMLDIELQMCGVVIVAAENGSGMRPVLLVDHRLDTVRRNDRALGLATNFVGGDNLFGDYDQTLGRFGLFFIFPTRTVDAAIALGVGGLHMNERHVRDERAHRDVIFAGEGAWDTLHVAGAGSVFEPVED